MGVGVGRGENTGITSKKLFSLIKNSRQDNRDISSLRDSADNMLYSENIKKANILNQQFKTVFTRLSPLRLWQVCTQIIQSLFHDNLPDDWKSSCPSMPEINIDLNGVLKLLSKFNPGKAAGPDSTKPIVLIVLKELRVETVPVVCLLFERSLQTDQLPVEWTNAQVVPFSWRVIHLTQQL